MTKFYNRKYEILINDETFIPETTDGREFKMTFEILIDYGGFITYSDVAIYNLSDETAAKAFKRGNKFAIRAGYEDGVDYLFNGEIRNAFKERSGPDTMTRIIARGNADSNKTINQTLGKGTKLTAIIKACVNAMGFPLVIREDDFKDVAPYAKGYTMTGDPRVYLDKLAQTHKFSYLVDKNKLIVTANNSHRQTTPVIVSQFEGMIGIPEISEVGCDVNVRLNPKIKIGGRIDVQTELKTFNFSNLYFQDIPESAGKGIYRIFKLKHSGDTHGDSWTTSITGIR